MIRYSPLNHTCMPAAKTVFITDQKRPQSRFSPGCLLLILIVSLPLSSGQSLASRDIIQSQAHWQRYQQLLDTSEPSRAVLQQWPGEFSASVKLLRRSESGSLKQSNAALIGEGPCFLLFASAGHSLLERSANRRAAAKTITLEFQNGRTLPALQLFSHEPLQRGLSPANDWGLILAHKPNCTNTRQPVYPPLIEASQCQGRTVFACHDFRAGMFSIERGCSLDTLQYSKTEATKEKPHSGMGKTTLASALTPANKPKDLTLFSCRQQAGMSGCALLCRSDNQELKGYHAMGIFTHGLRARDSEQRYQEIGILKTFDREFYRQISELKQRYAMD